MIYTIASWLDLKLGAPRPPFDKLIQRLVSLCRDDTAGRKSPVIVSVDIPSGWHAQGDVSGQRIKPDMLVSLTAPKLCGKQFCGPHHFVGGRFALLSIAEKYKFRLPHTLELLCVSALIKKWLEDAVAAGLRESNAMALPTAGKTGKLQVIIGLVTSLMWMPSNLQEWCYLEELIRMGLSGTPIMEVERHVNCLKIHRNLFYFTGMVLTARSLIPKSEHWQGYRLKSKLLEFWKGQPSPLHDRQIIFQVVALELKIIWPSAY
ncbi:hypothetical protein SAY86_003812 [Trapa natans]|uniref:NAD(P)H-hydrate epimerase n=1 Tax=Trapa natans TaxID=22666 RepID=A0AAN7MXC0_TRANT|nr:hypothetical protein SAY86_003812 [Trapa natans]